MWGMESGRWAGGRTIGGGRETSSEPDRMFIAEMLRRRQSGLIRQLSITAQRRGQPRGDQAGGFVATACQAQEHAVLLAVEDTTILTYEHAVASQLGTTSNNPNAKRRGDQVHSVLLLDALSEQTVGLIEQSHWCRE